MSLPRYFSAQRPTALAPGPDVAFIGLAIRFRCSRPVRPGPVGWPAASLVAPLRSGRKRCQWAVA